MSLLSIVLCLPAFLVSVFVIYWSFPIAGLFHQVGFLNLTGKRRDNYGWAALLCKFFRVRFKTCTDEDLYRDGICIYLCNHRSWADFFVDAYLTEGRAQLLSRMLVFYVFPVFMMAVHILKGVVLFKRGRIVDKEKFNLWMDRQIKDSPCAGLCVFPEGHRCTKSESQPLKRGMLHYTYSRKLPVQLIISSGKEHILSEKDFSARFDAVINTAYSPVIQSADFSDFDSFFEHVCSAWLVLWQKAFADNPAGKLRSPMCDGPHLPAYDYTLDVKVKMVLYTLSSFVLLAGGVYCSILPAVWFLRIAGPWWPAVALVAALHCAISFWHAGLLR